MKCFKMKRRVIWKKSFMSTVCAGVLLWLITLSGVHQHLFSLSFTKHYTHWGPAAPLQPLIEQIEEGVTPDILPVNEFFLEYISINKHKCEDSLYAGHVFPSSRPKRWKLSKWYVSLEEYPYSHYPPYVTAGAYLLSRRSLKTLYYAGLYTKFFKFDDVFMGMCAMKGKLHLFHHSEFHYYKYAYSIEGYKYVIASHGFSDPDEMHRVWEEQRSVGSA
ncbi:Glycosyl transferase family 31 [Trinorchestia longiramus]|nr:Glycosyl transferase family 31 [Trinorchestia longiramus]